MQCDSIEPKFNPFEISMKTFMLPNVEEMNIVLNLIESISIHVA
jgi:hypothetical protein